VVLVANAGVGSTIDQLLLNAALCAKHGANVLGCVLNRVDLERIDRIDATTTPVLARHGLPVLATIPDLPDADRPTFFDLTALGAKPISSSRGSRFDTFELVTMDLEQVYAMLHRPPSTQRRCLVLHASHHEHTLAIVALLETLKLGPHYALLLTGTGAHQTPLEHSSISIYRMEEPTLEVLDRIRGYTTKTNPQDQASVERVTAHYAHHLQSSPLLRLV
jgi:BioD-like phosphotransacetylase family protein